MHSTSVTCFARVTRKLPVLYKTNLYSCSRNNCASAEVYNKSVNTNKIDFTTLSRNTILISESRDIYENLALEDWLYKNLNFSTQNIYLLLMWYNAPAVVIGRHQNPWIECSFDFCQASGISVARRNSGGGTVYHDYGNLNCSFMGSKKNYNRKNNLQIICDAIRRRWKMNLSVTERDDILLNEKYKVSGTAAKLGKNNAYHHCTFLIDADELKLKQALHRDLLYIESRATTSTRSIVKNLKTICSDMDVIKVMENIRKHYQLIYDVPEKNIFTIHPTEFFFPGIKSTFEHLRSWKWCFGHTPRFTVTRIFPLCSSFSKWEVNNLPSDFQLKLSINKGLIESIEFYPQIIDSCYVDALSQSIIGKQFSPKINVFLEMWIDSCGDKTLYKFIKSCILQLILDVCR